MALRTLRRAALVCLLLAMARPAHALIRVSQETVSASTLNAASSTTITASMTPAAKSTIVAFAVGTGATGTTCTFSDGTNTWSTLNSVTSNTTRFTFTGYARNVAGSAVTVTATFSGAKTNRGLILYNVTGAVTTAAQTSAAQVGSFTSATDNITSGSMTASVKPALVVGFTSSAAATTVAAGTGFTAGTLQWGASSNATRGEWRRITATGTTAATFTGASGTWWVHGVILTEALVAELGFFGQPGLADAADAPAFQAPDRRPWRRRRSSMPASTWGRIEAAAHG